MPNYIIKEQVQKEKLKEKIGIKILKYKGRLRKGEKNELARRCKEEKRKRTNRKKIKDKQERERKNFLEDTEIQSTKMEKKWKRGLV